jgi:hypothetical protein
MVVPGVITMAIEMRRKLITRGIIGIIQVLICHVKFDMLTVTVVAGNHCANNEKDPYASTACIPAEFALYMVSPVTLT